MIPIYVTVFAGVLGLAFGSFLNVCATRWPEDESIVKGPLALPQLRPHAGMVGKRTAGQLAGATRALPDLQGVDRLAVSAGGTGSGRPLGVFRVAHFLEAPDLSTGNLTYDAAVCLANGIARIIFLWILVALAVMDAENLWLPDRLTFLGIALGFVLACARGGLSASMIHGGGFDEWRHYVSLSIFYWFIGAVASTAGILVIRWIYIMISGREGIGMGDVKLMAMIGGWLGVRCAVLAFGIAVILAALFALVMLVLPSARASKKPWRLRKLPFGTFLCVGAAVSAFWGVPLVTAYLSWAGF